MRSFSAVIADSAADCVMPDTFGTVTLDGGHPAMKTNRAAMAIRPGIACES